MGTRSWVNTFYGVDYWTQVMGQSLNESHNFERNGNKYTCFGHCKIW